MPKIPDSWASLALFPSTFEAYYSDHSGFRNALVSANNCLKVLALKKSPLNRIILGKQGWMYITDNQVIEEIPRAGNAGALTSSSWENTYGQVNYKRSQNKDFEIACNNIVMYP